MADFRDRSTIRDEVLYYVAELLRASAVLANTSPLLDDELLESLRPLFASGRELTGAEVRVAVLTSLARFGFLPLSSPLPPGVLPPS